MNREQLEHALRTASEVTGERRVLVIGSQSILGSFAEDELPKDAVASIEIDIGFFGDDDGALADLVEGAAGEFSPYGKTHSFYIDGVDMTTAKLPQGWWNRLVRYEGRNTGGAVGECLEPHDCVLSKLAAFREKDRLFAAALIEAGLVHPDVLVERAPTMSIDPRLLRRILDWVAMFQR